MDYLVTDKQLGEYRIIVEGVNTFLSEIEKQQHTDEPLPDKLPKVNFTADIVAGDAPLTVMFTNTTTNADGWTYFWSFGDGATSELKDTAHTYLNPGKYTVVLIAQKWFDTGRVSCELEKKEYISVTKPAPVDIKPVANFDVIPAEGETPLRVVFRNLSTGTEPMTYEWDFNNTGYVGSREKEPVGTYEGVGYHSVKLTVKNNAGTDSITKLNVVLVTEKTVPDTVEYGCPKTVGGWAVGGSAYGGGTAYPTYKTGDYIVSTPQELIAALGQATYGKIVYVKPTAEINMGEYKDVIIPSGVILASNRGDGSSKGGRIYCKTPGTGWGQPLFKTGGVDVRVTGLRLEGEYYPMDGEGSGQASYRIGILNSYAGFEVDNCELFGWAYASIFSRNAKASIHHNYIHHSQNRHEGYGVDICGGEGIIEGNVFDVNRHDITGDGEPGEKYTVRYNLFLGTNYAIVGMAHVDVHGAGSDERVSGERYDIYNNSFLGGQSPCVHQRGKPTGSMNVHHNIFYGNSSYTGVQGGVPVYQSCYPDCGNVNVYENYWNDKLYVDEKGIMWYQK